MTHIAAKQKAWDEMSRKQEKHREEAIEVLNDLSASLVFLVNQLTYARKAEVCMIMSNTPPTRHKVLKVILAGEAAELDRKIILPN